MEQVSVLVALAFAVNKVVSTVKDATNRQWNGVITQVAVWVLAFLAIVLAAHSQLTQNLPLPGVGLPLSTLDWPSQVLLALFAGSTGSVVFDFKKAFDSTDSAAEPTLLTPRGVAKHTTTPPA